MANVKFKDNSAQFLSEAEKATLAALETIGLLAEGYAKLELQRPKLHSNGEWRSTVDTGRLMGSITHATAEGHSVGQAPAQGGDYTPMGAPDAHTVCIGTNVPYALFVEEGTRKMAAQPYLKPAIMDHMDEYKDIINQLAGSTH